MEIKRLPIFRIFTGNKYTPYFKVSGIKKRQIHFSSGDFLSNIALAGSAGSGKTTTFENLLSMFFEYYSGGAVVIEQKSNHESIAMLENIANKFDRNVTRLSFISHDDSHEYDFLYRLDLEKRLRAGELIILSFPILEKPEHSNFFTLLERKISEMYFSDSCFPLFYLDEIMSDSSSESLLDMLSKKQGASLVVSFQFRTPNCIPSIRHRIIHSSDEYEDSTDILGGAKFNRSDIHKMNIGTVVISDIFTKESYMVNVKHIS